MPDTKAKEAPPKSLNTVTLTIDGQELTVAKGKTVLDACHMAEINVPTFCWHAKLKSVGACRICYVEIEKFPKLMVSCSTEAMDGMVVYTNSEKCRQGRKAVVEFTLLDHPLDCPTCDKGGECDLQDNVFEYGLTDDSRYDFNRFRFVRNKSSTFDDLTIGPEMVRNQNRCILCFKCVRANEEIFGESDIGAFERGSITEINAPPGQQVDSLYSGNLVEICPVGALTSSDWRYKIRVWNTNTVPSIDPYHSDGANTLLWKDIKKVYRATSRRNDDVDEGWLSDISRYGYQIATSETRLTMPHVKKDGAMVAVSWDEALELISRRIKGIKEKKGSPCLGGLISPNFDLATMHVFNKFMRGALGSNNIDYRSDYPNLTVESESAFIRCFNQSFVISEIGRSDCVLVVDSDLISEHPNVHLWTRKAVYENDARLYTANPFETKSGDCSFDELLYSPGSEVALLNGLTLGVIESGLTPEGFNSSDSSGLLEPNTIDACAKQCGVSVERIKSCAQDLAEAKKPCLIGGEIVSTSAERETISRAFSNLSAALGIEPGKKGQSLILPKAANSKGAEALGLTPNPPEALRGELTKILDRYPDLKGLTASQMYDSATAGELSGMVLIGSNPVQFSQSARSVEKALKSLEFLLVADLFMTPTAEMADVALPLSSFAEYDGAFVNLEGRQQDFSAGMKPVGESLPGFEALNKIAEKLGYSLFNDNDTLRQEIEKTLDSFDSSPNKRNLVEAKAKETIPAPGDDWYPIYVGDALHHFGSWTTHCESLREFDPEAYLEVSPKLARSLGIESGELVRVSNDNERVNLKLKVSERLKGNVVFASNNFDLSRVNRFTSGTEKVSYVRFEKINEG